MQTLSKYLHLWLALQLLQPRVDTRVEELEVVGRARVQMAGQVFAPQKRLTLGRRRSSFSATVDAAAKRACHWLLQTRPSHLVQVLEQLLLAAELHGAVVTGARLWGAHVLGVVVAVVCQHAAPSAVRELALDHQAVQLSLEEFVLDLFL